MVPTSVAVAVLALPAPEAILARAVERNEALYQDLDITYRSVYRHPDAEAVLAEPRRAPADGVAFLVMEEVTTVRLVRQHGLYRVAVTWRTDTGHGEPQTEHRVTAYDGDKTRTWDGKQATTEDGPRPLPREALFPHMWATGPQFETFPLSVFLAGGETWEAFPKRNGFDEYGLAPWLLDWSTASGDEPCVLSRVDLVGRRGRRSVYRYLLASRKNLLPVRTEKFMPYSALLPAAVVECGDFRELRPGVWLPFELAKTVYEPQPLSKNVAVVSNTTRATVLGAVVGPRHPPAFFRDLTPAE